MSNKPENLKRVQQLLFVWISKFDKRSLVSIRQNCDYLNDVHHLGLSNPTWSIFWPLVFNGVIDYAGEEYYAIAEPVVLDYGSHFYYINFTPKQVKSSPVDVGIIMSAELDNVSCKVMKPNPIAILKTYPSIKDIVDGFSKTLQNESELKYVNRSTNRGLAELEKDGLTRYFSLPESLYIRELPSRTVNPEAYALAFCLTRAVCNECNGWYNKITHSLSMPRFALPFMVYRVLLMESMATKRFPHQESDKYIFENISLASVKQLNRIFCNSIQIQ